jgi:hypothetical protein
MPYLFFEESQRFRQAWLWILMISTTLFAVVFPLVMIGKDLKPADVATMAFTPLLILGLFYFLQLKTRIDKDGIYYRFIPFHWKEKFIAWSDVDTAEVIKYSPIGDFGGWGIKYGRKGKAYNVSGNMGLYLRLKNGKKILFGTRRPEELAEVITRHPSPLKTHP